MYSSFSSHFISKKMCRSMQKKKKNQPSTRTSLLVFASIVHTSVRFQKKNQSQELWQVYEKGCVRMLHVKHSENKVPDKWHLKHKRYFHAQLLISLTLGGADRHHIRQGFAKKKKNAAPVWPGKANNQVGGNHVTMQRQCQTNSKHNNRHMQVTHRHHVQ